jgi:hypothetical protein
MRLTLWISTLLALVLAPPQPAITSATDLIASMQRQYGGSWYKTATFVQKTTTVAADGTSKVATWYEALAVPGSLRIDFTPVSEGNGVLFTDGKTFSFKDGKVAGRLDGARSDLQDRRAGGNDGGVLGAARRRGARSQPLQSRPLDDRALAALTTAE